MKITKSIKYLCSEMTDWPALKTPQAGRIRKYFIKIFKEDFKLCITYKLESC